MTEAVKLGETQDDDLEAVEALVGLDQTPTFSRQADRPFSEDERRELIEFFATNPLAGNEISGTSSVRRLGFTASGQGKRGVAMVIYYYLDEAMPIYALLAYAKAGKA